MENMKKFWLDRTALVFAVVGVILMAFTIEWNINPVEGSVVPRFLFDNPLGNVVFWILYVTCMPVFMMTMILFGDRNFSWVPNWIPVWEVMMFSLQVIICFLIGKVVSVCVRKLQKRKNTSP